MKRGEITVTLNYREIACRVIALRNRAEQVIKECDKIVAELDKAAVAKKQGAVK